MIDGKKQQQQQQQLTKQLNTRVSERLEFKCICDNNQVRELKNNILGYDRVSYFRSKAGQLVWFGFIESLNSGLGDGQLK